VTETEMNVRVGRRRVKRTVATLLAVTALVIGLTACATRAPSDSIVLYYTAGAGEDRHFQECIEPGTSGSYPVDDETFTLPTSLRTWNIRPQGGDTDRPINAGTRPGQQLGPDGKPTGITQPGPEVNVWATADFYLNTDCAGGQTSPIAQFWEKTGRRYSVSADDQGSGDGFNQDNWRSMLMNTLAPAEEAAVRQQSRSFTADDLDANTNGVWTALERQLGPAFNDLLRQKVGGDYFCGPGYVRGQDVDWIEYASDGVDAAGVPQFKEVKKRGKCPPVRITITDVGFTNKDIADARARVFTAEQNAKAALIDAQSKADVAAKLGEASANTAYVELQRVEAQREAAAACRANPNCTVIIDGTGGALVPTGRR
jgi:hypothetical protein